MKKLEKLKLNHLSKNALDERQQNALKGGCGCGCSGCVCPSWDGTGPIPPGQSSDDKGDGNVSANIYATLNAGFPGGY